MRLWDSHCHLHDPSLADYVDQLDGQVDVPMCCCHGTRPEDWSAVRSLADRYAGVVCGYGLHPWYTGRVGDDWYDRLTDYLADPYAVVGEIGLDRWYDHRDESTQASVLRAQLALARRLDRPVTLHVLRAWGWLLEIFNEVTLSEAGVVIHGFGGPKEMVDRLGRYDVYFSVAGNMLSERRRKHWPAIAAIGDDRLLVETDAPDMAPPWLAEGAVNTPGELSRIVHGVAALRGEPAERTAELTWANAERLFGRFAERQGACDG